MTLLVSNVIASKIAIVGSLPLPAGIMVFPISYIVADVLTEVYGYRHRAACHLAGVPVQPDYGGSSLWSPSGCRLRPSGTSRRLTPQCWAQRPAC